MNEEEFKTAINNILMMQNNNDHNFQILQAQIDDLQKQLNDLNDLKEMFRLPNPANKDRKAFDEVDWFWITTTCDLWARYRLYFFHKRRVYYYLLQGHPIAQECKLTVGSSLC